MIWQLRIDIFMVIRFKNTEKGFLHGDNIMRCLGKKRIILIIIAIIMSISFSPSFANELTDVIGSKKSTEDKIEDVIKQKNSQKSQLDKAKEEKKYVQSIEEDTETAYNDKILELTKFDEEIRKYEDSIADTKKRYDEKLEHLKERLRIMCKNTRTSYLQLLIESESIVDFLERMQVIKMVVKKDNELLDEMITIQKDYEYKQNIIKDDRLIVQNEASDILRSLEQVKVSRAEIDRRIEEINSKLNQLEWQLDELNEKAKEFEGIINRLIKTKGLYVGGNMTWPLPSCRSVSSYYGNRLHPIYKVYKMHTGIDIGGDWGKSIVAANSGTVILSGWQSGYGNTVIINHGGGITTLYAHSDKLLVKTGEYVEKGQTIAKVGSTGLSTGPHLHFEVRKNGQTVNPLNYVSP